MDLEPNPNFFAPQKPAPVVGDAELVARLRHVYRGEISPEQAADPHIEAQLRELVASDKLMVALARAEAAEAALKEACRHIQALVGIRCVWADPAHDITTKPARAFLAKHGGV